METLTRTKDNIVMSKNDYMDQAATTNQSKMGIIKKNSVLSTKSITKYLETYSTKNAKPKIIQ